MEVRIFSSSARPGVGHPPKREGQRPLLPQHARHCPVLEAGSALGYLVYPPLEPHEAAHITYEGEGRYTCGYFQSSAGGTWDKIFTVAFVMPVGSIGAMREEVEFRKPIITDASAVSMARAFIVPQDLGTPAGAIALRGATSFQTPPGWDTVYTPIFNMIERPVAPMLVVRVETDWYAHDTEFRYVLQPGEGMSLSHTLPIGQVVFVPREEITLRPGTDDERAAFHASMDRFNAEKGAHKQTTPYGLPVSPHYIRQSRAQRTRRRAAGDSPQSTPLGS